MKLIFSFLYITFLVFSLDKNEDWKNAYNSDFTSFKNTYTSNCQIITDSSLIFDLSMHYNNLKKKSPKLIKIKTQFSIDASDSKTYELVNIETEKSKFSQLIIIDKKEGKRELEFTCDSQEGDISLSEISIARNNWMLLCNSHNTEQLIRKMYQPQAFYYNHKPMIIGTKALINEYAYMSNPSYSLKLSPIHVEMVNKNTVFEIGQCSESYGGKYLIVWKKQKTWQVFLDSNI